MQKRYLVVVMVVLGLVAWVAAQDKKGPDVSGTWDMAVETPNGPGSSVLTLKQDGDKLTGQYQGSRGTGEVGGTLKGKEISFLVTLYFDGNAFNIKYTGQIDGESMSGDSDYGDYGRGTWKAKKRKN